MQIFTETDNELATDLKNHIKANLHDFLKRWVLLILQQRNTAVQNLLPEDEAVRFLS